MWKYFLDCEKSTHLKNSLGNLILRAVQKWRHRGRREGGQKNWWLMVTRNGGGSKILFLQWRHFWTAPNMDDNGFERQENPYLLNITFEFQWKIRCASWVSYKQRMFHSLKLIPKKVSLHLLDQHKIVTFLFLSTGKIVWTDAILQGVFLRSDFEKISLLGKYSCVNTLYKRLGKVYFQKLEFSSNCQYFTFV